MYRNTIILLAAILLFAACGKNRKPETLSTIEEIVLAPNNNENRLGKGDIEALIEKSRIEFQTFSSKIKVISERNGSSNPDVSLNVKMIKDSLIWISATASILNLEVYRLFVETDSVTLIDKLNTSYRVEPISYLNEITGLPFTLSSLQDFLAGNAIFAEANNAQGIRSGTNSILESSAQNFKTTLQFDSLNNLNKMMMRRENPAGHAIIEQENFTNTIAGFFPLVRKASVDHESENINAVLEFSSVEFNNSLQISMQPPINYTRN